MKKILWTILVLASAAMVLSCNKEGKAGEQGEEGNGGNGGNELPTTPAVDLSVAGTANCYIISQPGNYKFKATKGNSTESVGNVAAAEILWETYMTQEGPQVNDLVKVLSYEDGYVLFTTPGTLPNGNALVAVKDGAGDILWSWHLWFCKDFDPDATAQIYRNGAGTMMDRNLGSLSATREDLLAQGLLYQWGRKDPFVPDWDWQEPIGWTGERFVKEDESSTYDVNYTIQHPTTGYLSKGDIDRKSWNTEKTIHDPCPKGWRVPEWEVFSKAFGWILYEDWEYAEVLSQAEFTAQYRGVDFGTEGEMFDPVDNICFGDYPHIWYPANGTWFLSEKNGMYGRSRGYYWSCTNREEDPDAWYLYVDKKTEGKDWAGFDQAMAVRCKKE